MCYIATAIVCFAAACGVVLSVFSGQIDGHSFSGRSHNLAYVLSNVIAGVVGAVDTTRDGTGGPHTTRGMQELEWEEHSSNYTLVSNTTVAKVCAYILHFTMCLERGTCRL